jgi:DNA-binding winged helix-turn-helix (wHTH) protein
VSSRKRGQNPRAVRSRLVGYSFGPFFLDVACFRLLKEGREVPVQPRAFDTIRYLIEHRHRVVPPGELVEQVWSGANVTPNAVPWVISRARRVLGQPSSADSPIRTVRRRGYQFTASVQVLGGAESPFEPSSAA